MNNPFHNNYFCIAIIVLLLLIICNQYLCSNVYENMTTNLGSPGLLYSNVVESINNSQNVNYKDVKTKLLSDLDNKKQYDFSRTKEFFTALEKGIEVEEPTNDRAKYTSKTYNNVDLNPNVIEPDFYSDDETKMRMRENKNEYNTNVYPEPISDPKLGNCVPCKPCVPCKETVVINKLTPELIIELKKKLDLLLN